MTDDQQQPEEIEVQASADDGNDNGDQQQQQQQHDDDDNDPAKISAPSSQASPSVPQHPPPPKLSLSGKDFAAQDPPYGTWFSRLERKRAMYLVIYFCMLFCVVFIVITSLAPEPVGLLSTDCDCRGISQCICPRPTVEALTAFEIFCLANSRVAAYILYPLVSFSVNWLFGRRTFVFGDAEIRN